MLTMNSVKILHAVRSAITAIAELLVLHLYLLFYGRGYRQAAATATAVPLFRQTYFGITITSTSASTFCDFSGLAGTGGPYLEIFLGIFNVSY